MASLEIHSSADADSHKRFEILDEEVSIGTGSGCDIELPARGKAAANHARVVEHGEDDYLVLAIEGAIEVNGESTRNHVLEHGDLIRVGHLLLVFLEDGEPRPIIPKSMLKSLGSQASSEAATSKGAAPKKTASKVARSKAAASTSTVKSDKPPAAPVGADGSSEQLTKSSKPDAGIVIAPIRSVPQRRVAAVQPSAGSGIVAPVSGGARATAEDPDSGRAMRAASTRASARTPGGMPRWMLVSLALLLAVALVVVTVRVLEANSGRTPGDLLNLAEMKLARGEIAMARNYVDQAEAGELDDTSRRRIAEIRASIERVGTRQAAQPLLEAANAAYRQIHRFRVRYIDGKPPRREAAREFVTMSDEWLRNHREACSKFEDERLLVEDVESAVSPQRVIARMETPDNADDVLFRAGRRARFKPDRNYREALRICDDWLARNSSDPRAEEIRTKCEEWAKDSVGWAEKNLRAIRNRAAIGAVEEALKRLKYLSEQASLPAWHDKVVAVLAEVEGMKG